MPSASYIIHYCGFSDDVEDLFSYTVKSLNSGVLWVFKNLPVIERCPLLGGNFKKIVTFGTKCFVRYSWPERHLRCTLLGGFTANENSYLQSWFNYSKCQFHIGDEVQVDQPCHSVNQHWNNYDNSWQDSSSNKYFAEKSHLLIPTLNRK